ETKITRRPPFLTGPSLKRAVTIELNALTMRAPGARAATTSLPPLPPRSARTSFGLVSTKGFVASMSTRPFQAGRLFNADSAFGHFEQRWLLRELQRESDIGSVLVGWLSQPAAHRHACERQRSGCSSLSHRCPRVTLGDRASTSGSRRTARDATRQ